MAGLNAGDLDREIVLQRATVTIDPETGQDVSTWVDEQTVWAEWLPGSATEVWRARQIDASIEGGYVTYDLSPRPTPEASRIIDEHGRIFDVKGVTEIGRGDGLLIGVAARGEAP